MDSRHKERKDLALEVAQEMFKDATETMKKLGSMSEGKEGDEYFRDVYLRGAALCSLMQSLITSLQNDKAIENSDSPALGIASEIVTIIADQHALWSLKCIKYLNKISPKKSEPLADGHA